MGLEISGNQNPEFQKNEAKNVETAGTVASNTPSPLFTPSVETAGAVACDNASSGGGVSYNA